MLIGSEGILGVITEAWVRVHERPAHKLSAGVAFDSFAAGAEAVRALSQSGLNPANCRLLDQTGGGADRDAGDGARARLVLGFESASQPVDALMDQALELVRDHGGEPGRGRGGRAGEGGAVGAWRHAFLAAPYLRDTLVAARGALGDLRDRDHLGPVRGVPRDRDRDRRRAEAARRRGDEVMCRFTHVYPDGPAPYFTILAPARRGDEVEQWDEIKAAVSEALIDAGGTITHHHAVGRDHRPWYDRQRPEPFAERAARGEARTGSCGRSSTRAS